jgi:hypothetical protein
VSKLTPNYTNENIKICKRLLQNNKYNLPSELIIAVAWKESRLTQQLKPNPYKCVGPLQIKYKYWCPNKKGRWSIIKADGILKGCNTIAAGLKALNYYNKKYKSLDHMLCAYGPATCTKRKKQPEYIPKKPNQQPYVRSVKKYIRRLKR